MCDAVIMDIYIYIYIYIYVSFGASVSFGSAGAMATSMILHLHDTSPTCQRNRAWNKYKIHHMELILDSEIHCLIIL